MDHREILNISGPYGAGKDTLLNHVMETYGDFVHRVSTVTTRPASTKSDPSYRSVSERKFAQITSNGKWLVNYQLDRRIAYATSIDEIEREVASGRICIHSIFPSDEGAAAFRKQFGKRLCSVALLPSRGQSDDQIAELQRRMIERGREPQALIEKKLEEQVPQINFILNNQSVITPDGLLPIFDTTIVNEILDDAMNEIIRYFRIQFPQVTYEY